MEQTQVSVVDHPDPPVVETTVGALLRAAAADSAGLTAVIEGVPGCPRRWTFAELLERAEATAEMLLSRFAPGERLVVWGPSSPEWLFLEFGAALAGIVVVTANPALTTHELRYVVEQSRAQGIAAMRSHRGTSGRDVVESLRAGSPGLREVLCIDDLESLLTETRQPRELPEVAPGHPFMIQYTSGTTGFPKGVTLSHRNVVNVSRLLVDRLHAEPGSVWVNPLPLFHVGGSVLNALGTVWLRAAHCPVGEFDPARILELIESERGSVLPAVPTMLIHLLDHPDRSRRDISSLRRILSGGAAVPAELVRRIQRELGVSYCVMWGLTECSSVATQTLVGDRAEDLADTVGPPLPHTEVSVVDPVTGESVAAGAVGELLVRGPGVMSGYFENPEATSSALSEGWLHSGDLGSIDARGYVRISGRLKEMIIRGGENIYPREIEEHLYTHPGVAEAAVVGLPDDVWGEQVAAVIRPAAGVALTAEELRAFLRERLAGHKVPRLWRFVDAMPLTPSGKIKKFELRAMMTEAGT